MQEAAIQPSTVSEALASVTGKMTTGTAVLVSGTNFMLPMNFVKSGQQITVVSGGSKLLAAVPAVRSNSGATGAVSNAFVLQSLLSQANKVIQQQSKLAQPNQLPNQQLSGNVREKHDEANKSSTETKSTTVGLFQHSGVITSNPNVGQRIFNTTVAKFPTKSDNVQQQQQQVVCLTTTPANKNLLTDTKKTTTIALAFTPSNNIVNCTTVHKTNDIHLAAAEETVKDAKQTEMIVNDVEIKTLNQRNTNTGKERP